MDRFDAVMIFLVPADTYPAAEAVINDALPGDLPRGCKLVRVQGGDWIVPTDGKPHRVYVRVEMTVQPPRGQEARSLVDDLAAKVASHPQVERCTVTWAYRQQASSRSR